MFKVSQLRAADTAELHIKDQHGEPMFFTPGVAGADGQKPEPQPMLAEVYGPGSDTYRRAQLKAQRKFMALSKKSRKAVEDRAPEERAADAAELLADITVRIDGIDSEGRSAREALLDLFSDPACVWLTEQINAFAADWANFPKSAQPS